MKGGLKTGYIIQWGLFSGVTSMAHTAEWKTKKFDDGKITVSYRISDRIDEGGQKVPLIEDSSTIIDSLDINQLISLLKNVPRHRGFSDDHDSEKTRSCGIQKRRCR